MIKNKDCRYYLQELLHYGRENELISATENQRIQNDLFTILNEQIVQMNGTFVATLGVEQAEQWLLSICYQISYQLIIMDSIETQIKELLETPIRELYQRGHQKLLEDIKKLKKRFEQLQEDSYPFTQEAYKSVMESALAEFFRNYDTVKKAQELPTEFDYAVSKELENVSGISFVKEYVEALICENEFLIQFSYESIQGLMKAYSKQFESMSFNIFELVRNNVIANLILDCDEAKVKSLMITKKELHQLECRKKENGFLELVKILTEKMKRFLDTNTTLCEQSKQYVLVATNKFCYSYMQAEDTTYAGIVLYCKEESGQQTKNRFLQSKLRPVEYKNVIAHIRKESSLQHKITVVLNEIHHIDDLISVLEQEFYGEEVKELFFHLTDEELALLMNQVMKNQGIFMGEDSINWQIELIQVIQNLEEEQKEKINSYMMQLRK